MILFFAPFAQARMRRRNPAGVRLSFLAASGWPIAGAFLLIEDWLPTMEKSYFSKRPYLARMPA